MKCFPFELNFNVTCWQNRRARIYLDLKDFDVSNIDLSIPIHLILDFTHNPKNIIFDNRDLLVFSGMKTRTFKFYTSLNYFLR